MNRPKYKELYQIEKRKVNSFKRDLYNFLDNLENMGLNVKYYSEKPDYEFSRYLRVDLDNGKKYLSFRFEDEYGEFKNCFIDRVWRKNIKEYIDNFNKTIKYFCKDTETKTVKTKRRR